VLEKFLLCNFAFIGAAMKDLFFKLAVICILLSFSWADEHRCFGGACGFHFPAGGINLSAYLPQPFS
jgi:hypothetical protein